MKKYITMLLIAAASFTACNKNTVPQDNVAVEQLINSKQYVFRAETANPLGGTTVRLTSEYDLIIKPGQFIATLPYYGRAYTADRNFTGMRFTSNEFRYTTSVNDNGGWEIIIEPLDIPEVQNMLLSITEDGYAILYINSSNRQAISYNGKIERQNVK